ncbi:TrbC/VirB2 family protein [Acidiphilium sp.]|uniref:TrbC/VirB2 family protein n=1 Tax=Acidiphilium sp. TaxID=527 RepID=UPI003CFC0522
MKQQRELTDRLRRRAADNLLVGIATAQRVVAYRPVILLGTVLMMPAVAHAQAISGGVDPTTILQNIASFILGPFGVTLAVLAVIGVGFAFMLGRAGLGLIGGVLGGLVLIFGGSYIINQAVGSG